MVIAMNNSNNFPQFSLYSRSSCSELAKEAHNCASQCCTSTLVQLSSSCHVNAFVTVDAAHGVATDRTRHELTQMWHWVWSDTAEVVVVVSGTLVKD